MRASRPNPEDLPEPKYDPEAEKALLGTLLQPFGSKLQNALIDEAVASLDLRDFILASSREIFRAIRELRGQEIQVDTVAVRAHLIRAGTLELVGTGADIAKLTDGVPLTDNISGYIRIIKAASSARLTARYIEDARLRIEEGETPLFVAAELRTQLDDLVEGSPSSEPFRLEPWTELIGLPPPELIPGTHCQKNGLTVMYGPSESAKSLQAIAWSVDVSRYHPVVYVATEGHSGLFRRIEAYCTYKRISPGELYIWRGPVMLLDQQSVRSFIAAARRTLTTPPALIIFDTLSGCTPGGNENTVEVMGGAVSAASTIRLALEGPATLFIHHVNADGSRERGHSALRNGADIMIACSKDDTVITHQPTKFKDGDYWEPERFKVATIHTGERDQRAAVLLPEDRVIESDSEYSGSQRKVLWLLCTVYRDGGASPAQLVTSSGISPSAVYYALESLLTKECVASRRAKNSRSTVWESTEKGRGISLISTKTTGNSASGNGHNGYSGSDERVSNEFPIYSSTVSNQPPSGVETQDDQPALPLASEFPDSNNGS